MRSPSTRSESALTTGIRLFTASLIQSPRAHRLGLRRWSRHDTRPHRAAPRVAKAGFVGAFVRDPTHPGRSSATGHSSNAKLGIETARRITGCRIALLREQARELIAENPELERAFQHFISVKGNGTAAAVKLVVELAVLPCDIGVPEWVEHAGIDPRQIQSGTSVDRPARISRRGNVALAERSSCLHSSRRNRSRT